jgi:hypothetical protein
VLFVLRTWPNASSIFNALLGNGKEKTAQIQTDMQEHCGDGPLRVRDKSHVIIPRSRQPPEMGPQHQHPQGLVDMVRIFVGDQFTALNGTHNTATSISCPRRRFRVEG